MTDPTTPRAVAPAHRGHATRRHALGLIGAGGLLLGGLRHALAAADDDNVLTEAAVLRDPEIPVAGNPDGDITIVEFSDFQCPYCRKVAPDLRALVQEDGKIKMVFKDWPVLGGASVYAARLALACKFQDKYVAAHEALIGLTSRLTEARARDALARGRHRRRPRHARSRHPCQDHRRDPGAQRRPGQGLRLSRHAVLYRRKIPGARRAHQGAVRAGGGRCAQGQGGEIAAAADSAREGRIATGVTSTTACPSSSRRAS